MKDLKNNTLELFKEEIIDFHIEIQRYKSYLKNHKIFNI